MKLVAKVSKKTFGKVKLNVVSNAPTDYYNRVGSVSSSTWTQEEARFNGNEDKFIEHVQEVLNTEFPFNIFKKVYNHTYGNTPNADQLVPGNDWSLTTNWGYICDHKNQVYAYNTCADNTFGVFAKNGEYFVFAKGKRSVITTNLITYLSDDELNGKPLVYKSNGPKDMKFFETQSEYLICKGEKHAISYFATVFGKGTNIENMNLNEQDAFFHFVTKNPEFETLIHKEMFKQTNPEQYLLNKYRNKKIIVENLNGKDKIAWDALDVKIQKRILQYQ